MKVSLDAQASSDGLTTGITNVYFSVLGSEPTPPVLNGLVSPSVSNENGVLSPELTWVKDFPLTATIAGDADSYSASLGLVSGDTWTFEASNSGPYTLTAHRDGFVDSASGTLSLIEAQLEGLGPYVNTNGIIGFSIPCGEEINKDFLMNTESLTPTVNTTYATTTLPSGSSLDGNTFTYTPSCSPGSPTNATFGITPTIDAQGNDKTLDQVIVDIDITGVESGLQVFGLDYDLDGQVNNQFVPGEYRIENEVPYFCDSFARETRIISNDPDNTTYEILEGEGNADIFDNLLFFGATSANHPSCNNHPVIDSDGNVETPGGLENTLVIEATSPLGSKTFSVDTRAYSPMITHVYVEPGQTSGGSERDPYVVQFDENKFSEMINLSYDRISGQPHNLTLVPAISHYDVDLMRPTRSYTFESNNQPSWMGLAPSTGVISASPTASNPGTGFVFPWPEYTIKVGSTQGTNVYKLEITVTDD